MNENGKTKLSSLNSKKVMNISLYVIVALLIGIKIYTFYTNFKIGIKYQYFLYSYFYTEYKKLFLTRIKKMH